MSFAGGRRSSSSGSSPGPTRRPSGARSAAACPTTTFTARPSGRARSRGYWIESTGLGLTLFLTVALGALVGVVIVAQTLYASTTEHLTEFGTVKALGGGNLTVYGIIAEQASFAAVLGYGLAAGAGLWAGAGPGEARHEDDRLPDAGGPGLRGHAGALPGGRVVVVPQGGVARPGDGLPGLSR